MIIVRVVVGGSVEDDATAFVDAWRRAARGELVCDRVVAFESRETLVAWISSERYRFSG